MSAPAPWTPALPGLDDAVRALFANEPPGAAAARADGWERYRAAHAPDPRSEEWSRTPIRRFPFDRRRLAPPLPWREGRVEHPLADEYSAVISVGPDAITVDRRAGGGILIQPLVQALEERAADVSDLWTLRPNMIEPDVMDAALDAFWNAGIWMESETNATSDAAVLILYRPTPGCLLVPRILARARAESRLHIVELAEPADGGAMILAGRQVQADRNARIVSVLAQLMDDQSHWISRDHATAGPGAQAHTMHMHLGGRTVKTRTGGDAAGEGAHLAFRGFALGSGKRHVDQHTAQAHRHADTTSHLLFKCVVKDESYSLYRGLIAASRGAVRIDAYQKNNNLVLSDTARADSLPGLLIDADDLKCSHGATIGTLDDEQLFYLRSRGVAEADARRLLTEAFGEQVIAEIPHGGLRQLVRDRAATLLA